MFNYLRSIWRSLFPVHEEPCKIPDPVKKVIDYDTTPITQYMFDYVVKTHGQFKTYNASKKRKDKKTTDELATIINNKLMLSKSTSSYANIWNGHTKREDLPVGTNYFMQESHNE